VAVSITRHFVSCIVKIYSKKRGQPLKKNNFDWSSAPSEAERTTINSYKKKKKKNKKDTMSPEDGEFWFKAKNGRARSARDV